MRVKNLLTGLALAVLVAAPAARSAAAPVITSVSSGSFPLLNLGAGAPNARQAIATPLVINGGGITTIALSGGTASGDASQASGVYAGNQFAIATSPLGSADSTTNYLAAQPDTNLANNVTVNYATVHTTLDILWGTVDSDDGYNLITSSAGETITGADVLAVAGGSSGSTNAWLEITGLLPFTWIAASGSNGNPSAFEFLPGVTVNVPEPASATLLGIALLGFLAMSRRRHFGDGTDAR